MRLLAIIASIFISSIALAEDAEKNVCTKGYRTILRAGPNTKSEKLRYLSQFTPLRVLEAQPQWVKVKGPNFEGWVFGELVTKKFDCLVINNSSNFECPGHKAQRDGKISPFEGFKIIKKEMGCNFVQASNGQKMWINSFNVWPKEESMTIKL